MLIIVFIRKDFLDLLLGSLLQAAVQQIGSPQVAISGRRAVAMVCSSANERLGNFSHYFSCRPSPQICFTNPLAKENPKLLVNHTMAALNADFHTTLAAELIKKVNEANPFFTREHQLVLYKESTFPVLVHYFDFHFDENNKIGHTEETNVVICTALETFDGFAKDVSKIFGGEGGHSISVNWSNGTEMSYRSIAVDNTNFHTVLRMLEARPCVDEVIVRAQS